MARDYQKVLDENKNLKAELASTQKALEHSQEQNELNNRYRFGAHNEKLNALNIPSGDDITDPLSEEQEPEGHAAGQEKKKKKVVAFPEKEKSEEEKKKAAEDREARARARKMALDAIGDSRTRKMPTKMDLSGLPHTDTYDIDAKALDEEYGEGGWEIANWHKKDLLRHPMVSHYVETVHTPVIKILATGKLKSSPMPCVLLKGSPVTPEVLAHIIYEKYFKSVPLYRQSADMLNLGLFIPRQDMSNWIVRFSDEYLSIPYYYMQKLQCARKYGQCDESTLQVLHEPDRDARTKSYVWVHTTGELDDEGNPIVIFVYEPTRGTDHLRSYYASFSGALSSDAYGAYSLLSKESCGRILSCGCFMHARRRFAEALEVIKIGRLSREQIEALPEYKALVLIGKIYEAEGKLKSLSPEERLDGRIKTVRPLVEAYFSFLEGFDPADPLLSERMKDAISYSLNQKEQLCRFLEDGRIPCDNGYALSEGITYAHLFPGRRIESGFSLKRCA